jgi:GMP synthase (glutamine-hydrolysing)
LIAHLLGGSVRKGEKGEYGLAVFEPAGIETPLFAGIGGPHQIWMSHRDTVLAAPAGFDLLGTTATCAIAAIAEPRRRLYGLQFHPEVVHTRHGREILSNFVFGICACEKDWDPRHRIPLIEEQIRRAAGERNVFFFVSGGVDSSVAFTLCLQALGRDRVRGAYVDTGLMREGETEFVENMFESLGHNMVTVERCETEFLTPLAGVSDPEQKRHIIGEQFVKVQQRIIESRHLLDGHWVLGQGTIYPDTIESGGTAKAAVIKTHHNRVAGIQELIEAGRIVEPLTSFYKDEVREIGRELGLSDALLERHPFPGPGLAIRCLCADAEAPVEAVESGYLLPVRSVGVQGDERSYASVLALEEPPSAAAQDKAIELINSVRGFSRVVCLVESKLPPAGLRLRAGFLSDDRLERLRRVDAVVRKLSHESGFDRVVWQFPVVLIPLGAAVGVPDSVVLRPIDSVDGMTAQSMLMETALLQRMSREILQVDGVCAVFYDLTHKPPATIEWE